MKFLTALLLSFLLATPAAAADSKLLVSGALVDPSLIAPIVRLYVDRPEGTSYEVGLSGWTIDGEWRRQLSPATTLIASADATPLHAHNSNLVYVDGVRDRSMEFKDASYRARGGVRLALSPLSSLDARLVVMKEIVGDVPPEVEHRWSSAYMGVDVTHTWSKMKSTTPLIARIDGFDVVSRGELLTGERHWARASATERFGQTVGRVHFSQTAAVLLGSGLDPVNRFVVGGSWDALGGTAIYGTRYGELRLNRGVLVNGGADFALPAQWTAGARLSFADGSDDTRVRGFALNATKIWRTNAVNFGAGRATYRRAGSGDLVAYASVVVPLYKSR